MKTISGNAPFPVGTIVYHKSNLEIPMVVISTVHLKNAEDSFKAGEPKRWWQEEYRHDFKATCRAITTKKNKKNVETFCFDFHVEELTAKYETPRPEIRRLSI
jgi:hypothetical protein